MDEVEGEEDAGEGATSAASAGRRCATATTVAAATSFRATAACCRRGANMASCSLGEEQNRGESDSLPKMITASC